MIAIVCSSQEICLFSQSYFIVTVIELLQKCYFLVILSTIDLQSLQLLPSKIKTSACPEKIKFVIAMIEMFLILLIFWNNFQKLLLNLGSRKKKSQSFQFRLKFTPNESKELVTYAIDLC